MPQRAKGPRLYWHDAKGKWVIRDTGRPETSTGTADRGAAEAALAAYITARDRPTGPSHADQFLIAQALDLYGREHAPTTKAPWRIAYAIEGLLPFWGALPVSAIKGETCRRYARQRGLSDGTVRRELGVLRAALAHCAREGYLLTAPPVTLPAAPPARDRWLTRDEAARLIWAAWRAREIRKGSPTGKRTMKHLARFILLSLYTGTRKEAALALRFSPHTGGGYVDTANGVLYRRGEGQRVSKKRQPPARLPDRLLAHLRRWEAMGQTWVVEYHGARCGDIKTAWAAACEAAGLDGVTPHTLRHTAITWSLQRGASLWDASGYFGASVETIERVYGHHSPQHQESARRAMDSR